jgi:ABC-type amino acid transport substrate-binding protein
MRTTKAYLFRVGLVVATITTFSLGIARAGDLQDVKKSGVLRHIGIPYANFVSGDGDGMDVALMRKFAQDLGVRYQYVKSDWDTVVQDLTGKKVKAKGDTIEVLAETPVKGDLIANGFTILPWRQKVVDFSRPTFPSQIWLVARADSKIKPIKPSRNIERDIARTKALIKNRKVLALKKTCLDPDLYSLNATGAEVVCFTGNLNELAPAIINNEAEMTILDVPDALIALDKWPGKIKIIGPISAQQEMAVAFPKDAPNLRDAFNTFLSKSRKDGSYDRIVKKYYPTAFSFFPQFFRIDRLEKPN